MSNDGYFLSKSNPVANIDQRQLEDRAMALRARPEIEKAKMLASWMFREVMQHPHADQMDQFDNMVDEYVFHYLMRTVASDGQYPVVLRFMTPPHRWFGREVEGSRWGADSPDFCYRIVPVAHGGKYEITARATCAYPPTAHFALMGDNTAAPQIMSLLDSVDMQLGDDGSFVLTVDGDEAGSRQNHIQTRPGALQIWIRDALTDWTGQSPYALTVKRLNPPGRDPMSDDEMAQTAAKALTDGIYYSYFISRITTSLPPNQVDAPASSAALGGMATQYTAKAHVVLEPDEALIVTASSAGALFRNAVLTSVFNMSLNYWDRISSLNSGQMEADKGGLFTYVVAHSDPGVHNWLDPCGLRELTLGHRWQSFPDGGAKEAPTITSRLVKSADLESKLPKGVRRIDSAWRMAQLAERRAGYDSRFVDS